MALGTARLLRLFWFSPLQFGLIDAGEVEARYNLRVWVGAMVLKQ